MKIGIEAQRIFRAKKHGMDVVAIELIKNLQKIDRVNEYIIYAAPGEDMSAISQSPNFRVQIITASNYVDWEQIQLPRQVKKDKIDLLHCTCNTAPLWCPVKKIVTVHDTIFVEKQNWPANVNWYQKLGNFYRRILVPRVATSSEKVITPTEFEKESVIKYFKITPGNLHVVGHGVDSSFINITDQTFLAHVRQKYSLPEKFMFYLGNTEPRKNIHNVLKAYGELVSSDESIPELVITNIRLSYLQSVLKRIDRENLSGKIVLIGYADTADLPALYSLAEFFLYPSFREGFGLPILEAMACGTPVVTSTASAMPEIAGGAALLVDPFDYRQLKDQISKLVKSETLRQELKQKGLERARAFTWLASAEKVLKIYRSFERNSHGNSIRF